MNSNRGFSIRIRFGIALTGQRLVCGKMPFFGRFESEISLKVLELEAFLIAVRSIRNSGRLVSGGKSIPLFHSSEPAVATVAIT